MVERTRGASGEADGVGDAVESSPRMNGPLKAWLCLLGISAALFGAAIGVSRNFDHCPLLTGCTSTSADLAMGLLFLGSAGLFVVGTVVIGTIALLRSIDRQTFRRHAPPRRGRR